MNVSPILHKARKDESGAAMIIALLLATVLLALIAVLTAVTVRSAEKSADTRDSIYYAQAADAAIANAIMSANQAGGLQYLLSKNASSWRTSPQTTNFAVDGVVVKSSWYIRPVGEGGKYELLAAGYRESPHEPDAVVLKIRMEGLNTTDVGLNEDGEVVTQTSNPYTIMSKGFFATDSITFESRGAGFYDYSIALPTNTQPTINLASSDVAANGKVTFPFTSAPPAKKPIKRLTLHNAIDLTEENLGPRCYSQNPGDKRCYTEEVRAIKGAYNIKDFGPVIQKACQGTTPVAWNVAGTDAEGGVLRSNVVGKDILCLSSLHVNGNLAADSIYNAARPLTVYVTGNITVDANRSLQPFSAISASYPPSSLQIISNGTQVNATRAAVDTSGAASITASIIAPKADCSMGSTNAFVVYKGSLACKNIRLSHSNTQLYFDSLSFTSDDTTSGTKWAWRSTTYENVGVTQAASLFP